MIGKVLVYLQFYEMRLAKNVWNINYTGLQLNILMW